MGHELINIHLGTDDSPFVVRPVADLRGGGGFRGFNPPPLGLPSKKKKINVHRKTPS